MQQEEARQKRQHWKSDSLSAVSARDEPLEFHEYACEMPVETAAELRKGLGTDARFEAYLKALLVPPSWTYLRLNYLPHVDDVLDDDGAGAGNGAASSGGGGCSSPRSPLTLAAGALERRVVAAQAELETVLRATPWGKSLPYPIVTRHRLLPDVLVLPSVVVNSYPPPTEDGGSSMGGSIGSSRGSRSTGGNNAPPKKVVIVDRLCGEAVLKGADVFARGVLVCSSDLCEGDQEVELWCDLGDFAAKKKGKPQKQQKQPAGGDGDAASGADAGADAGAGAGAAGVHTGAGGDLNKNSRPKERVEDRHLRDAKRAAEKKQKPSKKAKVAADKKKKKIENQGGGGDCSGVGGGGDTTTTNTATTTAAAAATTTTTTTSTNEVVLQGSALNCYKGRRLRLGWGTAAMGRGSILKAKKGLALRVTARAEGCPSAPPLNGNKK
jgi:hypothetical protein